MILLLAERDKLLRVESPQPEQRFAIGLTERRTTLQIFKKLRIKVFGFQFKIDIVNNRLIAGIPGHGSAYRADKAGNMLTGDRKTEGLVMAAEPFTAISIGFSQFQQRVPGPASARTLDQRCGRVGINRHQHRTPETVCQPGCKQSGQSLRNIRKLHMQQRRQF